MGSAPSKQTSKKSRRKHRRKKSRKQKKEPKVELNPSPRASPVSERQSPVVFIENNDNISELDFVSTEAVPIQASRRTQKNTNLDENSFTTHQRKLTIDMTSLTSHNQSLSNSKPVTNITNTKSLSQTMKSQANDTTGDREPGRTLRGTTTLSNDSSKKSSVPARVTIQLPNIQRQGSATSKTSLSNFQKTGAIPSDNGNSRCVHCTHCQQQIQHNTKERNTSQPSWVVKSIKTVHAHVNMDEYDEEAIQEKKMLEKGSLPSIYEYPPRLRVETKQNVSQVPTKFITFPTIARFGSKILPTHTPFQTTN